eukprot:281604_1
MTNITFTTIGTNIYLNPTIRHTGYGISIILTYITLFFLNVKAWFIFYQYKWTKHALQLKWQMIINPNILNIDKKDQINWFILNKNKYGNLQYIYKMFGFVHLLFAIVCCICISFLIPSHILILRIIGIAFFICITLFTLVFYTIIIYFTPPFDDIYFIHRENKILAPILLIGIIIYLNLRVIEEYFNRINNNSLSNIFSISAQYEMLFVWTILLYISTQLIIKQNNKYSISNSNRSNLQIDSATDSYSSVTVSDKLKKQLDLKTALSDENTIDSFMKYLSTEWAMENLLSYIEFTNYQRHLLKEYSEDILDNNHIKLIEFAENVPSSLIVESKWAFGFNDKLHNPKIKAYKIYQKYIKIGSEFQINISSNQRKKVTKILNNYHLLLENNDIDINDLICIFNDCKQQVGTLLNHSLTRFKDESNNNVNPTRNAQIVVHVTDLSTNI